MSRSGKVRLFFGGRDYDFTLPIDSLVELEELRAPRIAALGFPLGEASVERMLKRLGSGGSQVGEVREVLRLGLIGGDNGLSKMEVADLVDRELKSGTVLECAKVAAGVLAAALIGVPEDQLGERKGGAKAKPAKRASRTDASAGPRSTAKARRSASTPDKPAG